MNKLGYCREFDGLRGIAIFLVVLSHSHISVLGGGFSGVDIFFVLSGFLITVLLVQEFDNNDASINFRNFYMRRLLRLGPALFLFLLVYLVAGGIFSGDWSTKLTRSAIALFYISNWVQAFGLYSMHTLSHTWSLSIEEQFYLIWPWVLYMLLRHVSSRGRIASFILFLIVIDVVYRYIMLALDTPWPRIHLGLDTKADPLLLGCLLGVALSSRQLSSALKQIVLIKYPYFDVTGCVLIMAWLLGFMFGYSGQSAGRTDINAVLGAYHHWGLLLVETGVALVILHVYLGRKSWLNTILVWRPLVSLGKISYGFYLWHFLVFNMAFKGFGSKMDLSSLGNTILVVALATVVTLVISVASYRFVELPILQLKKRFPG